MATNVLELRPHDRVTARTMRGAAITTLDDIRPAAEYLAGKVAQFGLKAMVWPDLATLDAPVDGTGAPLHGSVFGWSAEALAPWQVVDRAMRSPFLRAARVASEPLLISREGIRSRSRSANRLLDHIDLTELDTCPASATRAIVIPIHMPLGQIGAAILTPRDAGTADLADLFDVCAAPLTAAVWRFITGYVSVSRDERYLPTEGLLTTREIECLSWVAHGKTDYEISIILGCSHAGVRYHVTRACAKLGAVNRAQSVFRAAQLGYLGAPLAPRKAGGERAN